MWLAVIVVAVSLPLLTVAGLSFADLVDQQFAVSVGASFAAAPLFNFVAQVDGLLGRGVLVGLILGWVLSASKLSARPRRARIRPAS